MRLFRPGLPARCLYPDAIFRIKTSGKALCLTFDDGPDPESTPFLISILKKYEVRGIFFCNGRAAERNQDIVSMLKADGHLIGNHGYSHLNGWASSTEEYIKDIEGAEAFTSSILFRPPFGRLTREQYKVLRKKYRLFLWDVMPYDFDKKFGSERSLSVLKKMVRPGSVIVLHDSPGSSVLDFLEAFILFANNEGYRFDVPL
jgi:peptidoglycan/xylan/chitin deacetylase (PgdA/CDA1 family)